MKAKSLRIVWQRLVDSDGRTCDRCGATYEELQLALSKLDEVLRPLDIEPTFESREIDESSFEADPSQSNRIWIADKPIEDWLGARVSRTRCCSVCGDSECRTIELGTDAFEEIPAELILKAALVAAADMVGPNMQDRDNQCGPACCSA